MTSIHKSLLALLALVTVTGVYLHPLWLDSSPRTTLQLLFEARRAGLVPLKEIFGPADAYCAIGPYDSFQSPRFQNLLSKHLQVQLDELVQKEFPDGQSDNQFILAGISRDTIVSIYRTLFLDKKTSVSDGNSAKDCVDANGFAVVSRSDHSIYIR